ncbi:MAG: DMT family transporter [Alphaproteobacteria bacterium]
MSDQSPKTRVLSPQVRGALWMIGSASAFSMMTALIRPAAAEMHPFEIVFFRNALGLVFLSPLIFRSGIRVLRTARLPLHLLRATCFLAAMLCWFSAIPHIALVDAVTLNFTAPIFVTIIAAVILRERVRIRRWTAIIVGFAGALVVLRPGFQDVSTASILVLGDALIWSVSAAIIRILARTDSMTTIVAHMFIWVTPLSLIPALFVWQDPSWTAMAWLLGLAAASTVGHVAVTRAFTLAEISLLMPFDYTRLIFATTVGFFVFGEVPDLWTFVGAAIIVAAALYIAHREAQIARAARAASTAPAGAAE